MRRPGAAAVFGLAAVALLLMTAGCRRATRTAATAKGVAMRDTVRGTVRSVGAAPRRTLVLMSPTSDMVALSVEDTARQREVQAAEGLEIMAHGEALSEPNLEVAPRGAPVFRVSDFVVRAADGVSARDGILREQQGGFLLELASGDILPIVGLPTALRTHVGARVFLVGPMDQPPQAFGILRAAPSR